jgi:hypothetical protein
MTSSTSHFKIPKLLCLLGLIAALAWCAGAFYVSRFAPDVQDFVAGARIKAAWARQLSGRYTNKFIVFGGSSSTFSIDGEYALANYHFPLANLALGAGLGPEVLTRFALLETSPGDTLVMTMEPPLLIGKAGVPQLGQQFAICFGHPEIARAGMSLEAGGTISPGVYLSALRPGGFHTVFLFAKILTRHPLYRYKVGAFTPSGQKTTEVRAPLVCPGKPFSLSKDGRTLLVNLKQWCDRNKVRLVYALPWAYAPPDQAKEFQEGNLSFLKQVSEIMPVLQDSRVGAYTNQEHFADIAWHLNETGARIRTSELVESLQQWRIWTREDLEKIKL